MSVDRSLKTGGGLMRHRNVLTRNERLAVLADEERWQEGDSVFGLPKVLHKKSGAGKKASKKKEEEKAETEVEAAPAAE